MTTPCSLYRNSSHRDLTEFYNHSSNKTSSSLCAFFFQYTRSIRVKSRAPFCWCFWEVFRLPSHPPICLKVLSVSTFILALHRVLYPSLSYKVKIIAAFLRKTLVSWRKLMLSSMKEIFSSCSMKEKKIDKTN